MSKQAEGLAHYLVLVYQPVSRGSLDKEETTVGAWATVTTDLRYPIPLSLQGDGVSGQVDDLRQAVTRGVVVDDEVSFLGRDGRHPIDDHPVSPLHGRCQPVIAYGINRERESMYHPCQA